MARTEFTDIYCNSCIYASENDINSCQKYREKSQTILKGGVCSEYIKHEDKYLSDELAYQLDQAILYASDISMEHAISMGNSVKHSQCSDCINSTGFSSCKIFNEKPDNYSSALINTPCPRKVLSLKSRIKGALYGFAIGDAMGATTEFMSYEEIKEKYGFVKDIIGGGWLHIESGQITDDTQMTLCVCKALKDTIDLMQPITPTFYEKCCENFVAWYDSNPIDVGNCCRNVITNCRQYDFKEWVHYANNPNSLGNGSLMRSMPLVLANQSLETALVQGRLTHNNSICDECIEEYYLILKQCIDGELDKIPLGYKLKTPTGHVENTCNNAMYWLFETESVEEAIIGAVNHGGDADTIAAITGSLAGAYYGFNAIPSRWVYSLSPEVSKELDSYTDFFLEIYENKNYRGNEQMVTEMDFKKKIESFQVQISEKKPLIFDEENTKQALINPFLLLLGYDVCNPNEVQFEFEASFSDKSIEKVDYAIKLKNKPLIFVEAKKVNEDLSKHYKQLKRYLAANNDVMIGILTNGTKYEFYSYFAKQKNMDEEPFFEIDFENLNDEQFDMLMLFRKQGFDLNILLKKGEELWYNRKITQKLKELLNKPSDDFIRLLVKDYSSTRITSSAIEKFRPIVNNAITTAITDITQESVIDESVVEKTKNIITTDEELKAYEMVKNMLTKVGKDISDVDYKDTESYFAIYNRNVNGWFVRFILDRQPTLAMIRLEYSLATEIPTDLKIQHLKTKKFVNVYFDSIKDIDRLEPFILKAFKGVE